MKRICRNIAVIMTLLLAETTTASAQFWGFTLPQLKNKKVLKVKFTGTMHEEISATIGDKTERITQLPIEIYVEKDQLPVTVKLASPNYEYQDITIHKKEPDGHIYLVKGEKVANSGHYMAAAPQQQPFVQAPVKQQSTGVDWSKEINKAPTTGMKAENTFALIIANEEYEMAAPVAMANNDGEVFKEYCQKTLGLGANNIKYYPNATFGKMARAFKEIQDIATAFNGDINLIVYYAGHGIPDNATKDAYIMPVDADGTDVSVCYSLGKIYQSIESMHIKQCVVFLDACFSGAKRDGEMIVAARGIAMKPKEEKPKSGTVIFSATSDEEAAYSYEKENHGLFTYFLLKKLQETKGKVNLGELADYIKTQVQRNSIVINGKKQTPNIFTSDDIKDNWRSLKLNR